MSRAISFIIPFEVTAASRPKVTKYGAFYGKNYTAFREVVGDWLDKQIPTPKLTGALKARFVFVIKLPKSYSAKKKERLDGQPMIFRGDIDNQIKAICDVLQNRYFDDDCQIYHVTASKYWGEKGRIEVYLEGEE